MAICVSADAAGQLRTVATPVEQCAGLILLQPADYQQFQAANAPFDYGNASAIWAFAFSTVVGLWLVSHSIGLVLGFLRRA
ncbi:hypothetical protein K5M33_03100 [Chromobacterium vaccinii]|nr:hypothetical protein [Chromobacterium vaccinii]MBX9355689.1 hypothetical protein [Chromobacterium vaccinii]